MTLPPGRGSARRRRPRPARARRRCAPSPGAGRRASVAAVNLAPRSPRCRRSGSSHASRIWAADPASSAAPSRPGRCRAARWTARPRRRRPARRPGAGRAARSRRSGRGAGSAPGRPTASSRSSPAAVDNSARRGPSTKRPCVSRVTMRWCSSATASRWAVGRARPVAWTSCASDGGAGFQGVRDEDGLVQYADSARVVHAPILTSRHMRRKSEDVRERARSESTHRQGGDHGPHTGGEGLGRSTSYDAPRASPTSSTSTCTSSTR